MKWIEAAGGRAVPIRFYVSDGELRRRAFHFRVPPLFFQTLLSSSSCSLSQLTLPSSLSLSPLIPPSNRLFDSVNGIIFPGGLTDLYLDDPYGEKRRKRGAGRDGKLREREKAGQRERLFLLLNLSFSKLSTTTTKKLSQVAAATKLYDWAVESNDAGRPFPIWGTCLGHQLLQIIVTKAHFGDILVETDAVVS